MAIDHVNLATHDMGATRAFYEGTLGFRVVIHETLPISEGGSVDHIFFDTGDAPASPSCSGRILPASPAT